MARSENQRLSGFLTIDGYVVIGETKWHNAAPASNYGFKIAIIAEWRLYQEKALKLATDPLPEPDMTPNDFYRTGVGPPGLALEPLNLIGRLELGDRCFVTELHRLVG